MDSRYPAFPKVTAVNKETVIEVEALEPDAPYTVRGFSKQKGHVKSSWERELRTDGRGTLRWAETFPDAGEYLLDIFARHAGRSATTAHIFALPADLARRWPLRCDFHIHTYYSDGSQPPRSPTEMAVRGRELGLDVIAITDHDRHAPSLEAITGVKRLGLHLLCLPGEEVSFPDWHILSVATDIGIRELYESPQGQAEIGQVEQELAGVPLAGGLTAAEYAPLKWAIRTIHRHGGRAYLAHPYWVAQRRYHLDVRLYDQLVAEGEFDGIELLGDVDYEDNLLSIAHYQVLLAQGYRIPILGNSDTHGAEHTYGCYWTIAFAEEVTAEGVLNAIAEGYSVACSTVGFTSRREGLRIYGPVDLVEYAHFLEREFFPLHNALCQEEAALAYATLQRQEDHREAIAAYGGKLGQLYRRCFASLP